LNLKKLIDMEQTNDIFADEVSQEEVIGTSSENFIVANTSPIGYNELKHKCIIPVFAKDNHSTTSHIEFIDTAFEAARLYFSGEQILYPSIRISHPVKGRTPEAMGKPVEKLLEHEKTIYYERMAFLIEIPSVSEIINGNRLSLCIGGVRAYNTENLYGKRQDERFKVFIGYKNHVCINLCIHTDGYLSDLRVNGTRELLNEVMGLLSRFEGSNNLNTLRRLEEYHLTESQFALMVGRSRLYQYLPSKSKSAIARFPLSDTQISTIAKDYYTDREFGKTDVGAITLWRVYNLFTQASKSSYIDTFLDRNCGSYSFMAELINHISGDKKSWYLS